MKKFFYSVLAAATMLFATTSCSQDEEIVGGGNTPDGKGQKVTFTVGMPEEANSRAIADGVSVGGGNKADNLIWALYEKDKNVCLDFGHVTGTKNTTGKHEFTAEITMVKGLTYNVLFFAYDDEKCAFELASTPEETDLTALKLKTTDLVANEEGYDAFVKCHEFKLGGKTDVVLTRPFAQVNAATTVADLDKAKKLQAVVTKSELVINGVPTQYNVLTGETTAKADLTYQANAILTNYQAAADAHPNEDITVKENGVEHTYKYLAMAYVLAGETATSNASTHQATFNFYRGTNGDDLMRTIEIVNLPIQRNWRTNVIGDLLTKEESFKITIDHIFTGDHNVNGEEEDATTSTVATVAELQAAIDAASGPTIIKFEQDIDANSSRSAAASISITQKEGVDLVIDGCGYKFNGTFYIYGNSRSTGTETLTFKNIEFEGYDNYICADFRKVDDKVAEDELVRYAHNVTIDNCSFVGTNKDAAGMYFRQAYNIKVQNTTASGLHSLMWADGTSGITFDNVTVSACQEGAASFGTSTNVVVKNSTITLDGADVKYGISVDGNGERALVVANSTIEATTPVVVRYMTGNYDVKLEGENTLTPSGKYHVAFIKGNWGTWDVPTGTWSITGADDLSVFPREVLVTNIDELNAALQLTNPVIKFGANITGDATVVEKENNNIVIDGCEFEFDGQIKIQGNSETPENCTTLIKNINFKTSTASRDFIWSADSKKGSSWRYAENVTIENCTFTAEGSAVHTAVGARFQQAYNIKVVGCTATNMHSLLQAESCGSNVSVEGSEVINGKNGVSFNNTMNAMIANTIIEAVGEGSYGIRHKGEVNNYSLKVTDCSISAFVPVLVRNMKASAGYSLTLEGTNSLTANSTNIYQIVLSNIDYDGTQALVKPTGDYTITGAEGFNVYPTSTTLNASSTVQLTAAIAAGATSIKLAEGNYTMPEQDLRSKSLTITGTKETVIDMTAVDARDQFVTGATLVFDGVTLDFGKVNYMGLANTASLTYKNCKINGLQFLYGPSVTFENCELNSNGAEHCVWTYGAKNVSFTECNFTYGDRGINCYSDNDVEGGKQTVNFNKCTFATENTASEGAVEINSIFFSVGIEVNMEGCTAPAYGKMAYVSPWDSSNGAKTTINIK